MNSGFSTGDSVFYEFLKDAKDDFFVNAPVGYALHEIVFDENETPCDYRYLSVNPAFERCTGLKASEILGKTVTEIIPDIKKDSFNWIEFYADIALNDYEKDFDQFSSPLKKWYRVKAYSPEKKYFVTLISTITNEDQMFYEALDKAADSIVILDKNVKIRYVNSNFVKVTGYSKEEVVGRPITFLNSKLHHDENFLQAVSKKVFRGETWSGIIVNKAKNGALLYEETKITPITDGCGEIVKFVEIKHDLSESYRIKKELIMEKERLEALTKSTPDFVCFKDSEGKWLELNESGKKIFMMTDEDYLGKTEDELIKNINPLLREALEFCSDSDKVAWEKREPIRNIEIIPNKKGEDRFFDVVKCPVFYPNGERKALIILGRDLTEQKLAEMKLKEEKELEELLRKKAQVANEAKSEFIAKMSHELRTPLNGIIGFTSLLLSTELNNTQKDFLNNISYSSSNLLELINHILDFSHVQSGKVLFKNEDVKFNEFIMKTMNIIAEKAEHKGLKVSYKIDSEVPDCIKTDSFILSHILTNLLHNAVKFTDEGEIGLIVEKLGCYEETCMLKFLVYDTGIGISEEKQTEILDHFNQVDNSLTRQYEGTGLGLAIANKLIEKLGSKIRIKSVPKLGSEFSFVLKTSCISKTSEYTSELPSPELKAKVDNKLKILVVEDNFVNLKLLRVLIERRYPDVEFLGAENGAQGVEVYKREIPDLVLMDIHMPVMDGIMATEKIRQHEGVTSKRTSIIGVTAELRDDIRQKGFEIGIDDYITKPINSDVLYKNIDRVSGMN